MNHIIEKMSSTYAISTLDVRTLEIINKLIESNNNLQKRLTELEKLFKEQDYD